MFCDVASDDDFFLRQVLNDAQLTYLYDFKWIKSIYYKL